jgi:site-specific recombinase XerD
MTPPTPRDVLAALKDKPSDVRPLTSRWRSALGGAGWVLVTVRALLEGGLVVRGAGKVYRPSKAGLAALGAPATVRVEPQAAPDAPAPQAPTTGELPPLTPAALRVLVELVQSPVPRQEVNPGIVDRLTRGDLVEEIDLPSPYKMVKGRVPHLSITPTGRAELTEAYARGFERGGFSRSSPSVARAVAEIATTPPRPDEKTQDALAERIVHYLEPGPAPGLDILGDLSDGDPVAWAHVEFVLRQLVRTGRISYDEKDVYAVIPAPGEAAASAPVDPALPAPTMDRVDARVAEGTRCLSLVNPFEGLPPVPAIYGEGPAHADLFARLAQGPATHLVLCKAWPGQGGAISEALAILADAGLVRTRKGTKDWALTEIGVRLASRLAREGAPAKGKRRGGEIDTLKDQIRAELAAGTVEIPQRLLGMPRDASALFSLALNALVMGGEAYGSCDTGDGLTYRLHHREGADHARHEGGSGLGSGGGAADAAAEVRTALAGDEEADATPSDAGSADPSPAPAAPALPSPGLPTWYNEAACRWEPRYEVICGCGFVSRCDPLPELIEALEGAGCPACRVVWRRAVRATPAAEIHQEEAAREQGKEGRQADRQGRAAQGGAQGANADPPQSPGPEGAAEPLPRARTVADSEAVDHAGPVVAEAELVDDRSKQDATERGPLEDPERIHVDVLEAPSPASAGEGLHDLDAGRGGRPDAPAPSPSTAPQAFALCAPPLRLVPMLEPGVPSRDPSDDDPGARGGPDSEAPLLDDDAPIDPEMPASPPPPPSYTRPTPIPGVAEASLPDPLAVLTGEQVLDEEIALLPADARAVSLGVDADAHFDVSGIPRNTATVYSQRWRLFVAWCAANGLRARPVHPETHRLYLLSLASAGKSPSTIEVSHAAIGMAHRKSGIPYAGSEKLRRVVAALRHSLGSRAQGEPIDLEVLGRISRACRGDILAVRDRALLLTVYFARLQRPDAVQLTRGHLERHGSTFLVRLDARDVRMLRTGQDEDLCPVRALDAWLAERVQCRLPERTGPLFVGLHRGRRRPVRAGKPLTPKDIDRVLHRRLIKAGLKADAFASLDLRATLLVDPKPRAQGEAR